MHIYGVEPTNGTIPQWSYDTYTTFTLNRDRCPSGSDTGNAVGSVTGYSSSAYLVGALQYPDDITTGSGVNCTTHDWSDGGMTFVRIDNPFVGYALPYFSSSTDTEAGNCYNLEQYDVIIITVSEEKCGSEEFSAGVSSTIVGL